MSEAPLKEVALRFSREVAYGIACCRAYGCFTRRGPWLAEDTRQWHHAKVLEGFAKSQFPHKAVVFKVEIAFEGDFEAIYPLHHSGVA